MSDRHEYLLKLTHRAEIDPDFRQRLLSDTHGAVTEELGIEIPEGMNIRVVEEQPGEAVIVLPPTTSDEVSDEELAGAAGGGTAWLGGECNTPHCTVGGCPPHH
jgi:hypothetical protein